MAELEPSGDALTNAEQRIAWVLAHSGMSVWLKDTLRTALDSDPVQVLSDLEMLKLLLAARADALLCEQLDPSGRYSARSNSNRAPIGAITPG